MPDDRFFIGIGTIGAGLWVSHDAGRGWRHIQRGPSPESNCRAFAVSPHRPGEIFASTDGAGIFRSIDNGGKWDRVGEATCPDIWSIAYDPNDQRRIYIGTSPGISRSTDGGATFQPLDTSISPTCPIGTSRTTNVVVDPSDSSRLWASVEVDGLHHSTDGGDTWRSLGRLGPEEFHNDVHGLTLRPTTTGAEIVITTPFGLGRSTDDGASFAWHAFPAFDGARFPYGYSRGVCLPAEDIIIVCVGDYVPGAIGALEISRDGGTTWSREPLPVTPNSTMYWLATHAELPGIVVATSLFGQVFVSNDYGDSWRKLDREFGEIRAVAIAPAR